MRFKWIDVCRGIGICLVVLGHTVNPFVKIIYGFHMPLFFLISGYLFKQENDLKSIVKKSFERYIIPYFVLCLLNLLFEFGMTLFSKESIDVKKYVIGILYSRGTNEWLPNCGPLWFLTSLFCAIVLYKVIDVMLKKDFVKNLVVFLIAFLGYVISLFDIPKLIWNVDTAMVAVLFLHVGFLLKKYDLINKIKPSLTYICGCVIGMIAIYYNPIRIVNFDSCEYGEFFLMILGALSVSIMIMFFCVQISEKFKFKFLSFLGKHTVFIMGFDYFSARIFKKIMQIFLNVDFTFWDSGELKAWIVYFIGKLVILTIGAVIWTFVVNKISSPRIRKLLSY